jgi:hypothetical protein
MEYSIGNIYVAFSWSGYFTNLLDGLHLHMPEWLTVNYRSAHAAALAGTAGEGMNAWNTAPAIAGLRIIFDLPAVAINTLITWLVYTGVKESRNVSNAMVIVKLVIIVLVILVGVGHVDLQNWEPFMPNGFGGVMAGVSAVFFAYIGFDAVSTLAEESRDPQRDLPRGMIWSLVICTVVYIALALVLTGMVKYDQLGVSDPLAEVFKITGIKWMLFIVSIAAVVAMTSVMLVFPARPAAHLDEHEPRRAAAEALRFHSSEVQDTGLCDHRHGSRGRCAHLFHGRELHPRLHQHRDALRIRARLRGRSDAAASGKEQRTLPPSYINGQWIAPGLLILAVILLIAWVPGYFTALLDLSGDSAAQSIPLAVFWVLTVILSIAAYLKKWSLIPLLGLVSCCYLLTGMAVSNWKWFAIWLVIGLVCYFLYGWRNSRLARAS